jgi:hypothetical protein
MSASCNQIVKKIELNLGFAPIKDEVSSRGLSKVARFLMAVHTRPFGRASL